MNDQANLLPHQQRVVAERDELVGKLSRLYDFVDDDNQVFSKLDDAEKDRLRRQLGHMTGYAEVLGERIAAFQQVIIPESAIKSPEPEAKAAETPNPVAETIRDYNELDIERLIQAKGLTAPRVTPADIDANIKDECYFTAADGVIGASLGMSAPENDDPLNLLTFCVLVLKNGFTVTGESACASPENFDAEIGRKIARQNAVNKIWPLMGYALKQRLHDQ